MSNVVLAWLKRDGGESKIYDNGKFYDGICEGYEWEKGMVLHFKLGGTKVTIYARR